MGTNIKLKDLYNEELTYEDISTVSVPKADGSGSEFYVKRPTISYTLLDPPTHELAADSGAAAIVAWNIGDGLLFDDVETDKGNFFARVYGPREGKTTKPFVWMSVGKYTAGLTVNSKGMAVAIYLYEEVTGAVLQEIIVYEGATDFTAQIGWGQLLIDDSNNVTGYAKIVDPSAVTIGVEQPNEIGNAANFYALFSEVTQEVQSVSVTENGEQAIVPAAGKSGIRKLALSVNVPTTTLQEKAVTFTTNGTQEITPDEGYDGMSKLTATVNVEGGSSDYYLLQNPTGTMPTYPNSSKTFVHTDAVIASGFQPHIYSFGNTNAIEAYGVPAITLVDFRFKEPTTDSFANRILFINSASAATLSQAVIQMFLGSSWTFGAMTLAVGWNVCTFTVDGSGTTTAVTCTATTIDAINMTLKGYGGIPKNNFDWAAMDAYTLSFFKLAGSCELQEKSISITQNGLTEVVPGSGYDGLSKVSVEVNVPSSGGADAKSWVFTNGVAPISQEDFDKYLAPGVAASIFINVPLAPIGGTGDAQMLNVKRSESSAGEAQLIFAAENYTLDDASEPKVLSPTVVGFGIIGRATEDANFTISYVNAYGNTITPAFTFGDVQVTLYSQLMQL